MMSCSGGRTLIINNPFSLKNKRAAITGGTGLIGSAITKCLVKMGCETIILDIDDEAGKEFVNTIKDKKSVWYENFDITDFKRISNKIEDIEKKYGHIDIWINNAYPRTSDWGSKLENVTIESWQKNIDIQLNSYCLCSNAIAKVMSTRKKGTIINIASIYGIIAPDFKIYEGTDLTMPAAYSAIKGGIISYTKYLASYYGKDGIRVNAICPGGVFNNQSKTFVEQYSSKTMIGRMAEPEEIAWPVVFLTTEASSYITGTTLIVDGGLTAI